MAYSNLLASYEFSAQPLGGNPVTTKRSYTNNVIRAAMVRQDLMERENRVRERSEKQRNALKQLLNEGGDISSDAVYELFHQKRQPHDQYYKIRAKNNPDLSSVNLGSEIAARQNNYHVEQREGTPGPALMRSNTKTPDIVTPMKGSRISKNTFNTTMGSSQDSPKNGARIPVSWPPLRSNNQFSEGEANASPEQLQKELMVMHAQLQRDEQNERKIRVTIGSANKLSPIGTLSLRKPGSRSGSHRSQSAMSMNSYRSSHYTPQGNPFDIIPGTPSSTQILRLDDSERVPTAKS